MKKTFKRRFFVPIYDSEVWLVVGEDVLKERQKMDGLFGGPCNVAPPTLALCCCNDCVFGLFFSHKDLTIQLVAHEVFHLTHRILEYTNSAFDAEHHEQGALLHGYLFEEVWRQLEQRPK